MPGPEDDDTALTVSARTITEVTRREIFDRLTVANGHWSGRLQEDEFLSRLYDLDALPSTDSRYRTAAGDIQQHCVRNNDWSSDWVLYDSRFSLMRGADESFLAFLCLTVHPTARPDSEEALRLVAGYNEELGRDGWELFESRQLSGRPVFEARRAGTQVVSTPRPAITSATVERAINDAETLIRESGATSGVDRIHTVLHGYLIAACEDAGLAYPADPSMTQLFKLLWERHPRLQDTGPRAEDIRHVLRSMIAILGTLDPVRNRASVAHPNPTLLAQAEAMLVINAVRTVLHYLDAKLSR